MHIKCEFIEENHHYAYEYFKPSHVPVYATK